ncbi:MAG: Rho termination factor N-terminal domain-containing protein [Bacilli bacterium]|nr:Rho termination factor N-terminal domain-containing protein [Bacilli bacterium]MDD4298582.1 Rho termination factor N-terminal domain-containing protein [Bacilli bacterium]
MKEEVKEEKPKKVTATKATKKEKEDLSKFTVAELKEKAKAAGIVGYSKLKKDELIKVLQ